MKRNVRNLLENQIDVIKKKLLEENDIDSKFFDMIYDSIYDEFGTMIASAYGFNEMYENTTLLYRLGLSIVLNYKFDVDRMNVEFTEQYIENFKGRIVSQLLYSEVANSKIQISSFLNHPAPLSILVVSTLLKTRAKQDINILKKKDKVENATISILLEEAMKSLESTILLLDNNCYSQAMTVFRLYLEQIIIATSIVKNPSLLSKYIYHQNLSTKYAINTSDKEVLKVIEEKEIPARDIKSYLNYGWIEDIPGYEELCKKRYSIKVMAKLCNLDYVYELYSDTTNYVHMNFMYADINWIFEINRIINTSFATLLNIINLYEYFVGCKFTYGNIDMKEEFETISSEFIKLSKKYKFNYIICSTKNNGR